MGAWLPDTLAYPGSAGLIRARVAHTVFFPQAWVIRSTSGLGASAGSIKKAAPVITGITARPGAKDQAETGHTAQDLRARVVLKIGVQRGCPLLDGIERGRLPLCGNPSWGS